VHKDIPPEGSECMVKYPTTKAIASLIEKLNLPQQDLYSQDWELEVVNSKRIPDFIACYESTNDIDEKFTLMIIIIGSCNDALVEGILDEAIWEKVKAYLIRDNNLHKATINYWALEDYNDLKDCFEITSRIREIKSYV